jgi:2,4-dichlorophenol 6-monooxygenase
LRQAIAFKKYEFDAHGVEMNQRYASSAIHADGQPEPDFDKDAALHHQATTWPGARLPHAWVFEHETGAKTSTLDLCGRGKFTLLTGIGGEAWVEAAEASDLEIRSHVIGPRQPYVDHAGDWARTNEIDDTGCILVRPDHHVAWRAPSMVKDPASALQAALNQILSRG